MLQKGVFAIDRASSELRTLDTNSVRSVFVCLMQLSVVWDLKDRELRIYSDAGRCCRPLYIVDSQKQQLMVRKRHIRQIRARAAGAAPVSLEEAFFKQGLIEYIDADEVMHAAIVRVCWLAGWLRYLRSDMIYLLLVPHYYAGGDHHVWAERG